MSNKILITVNGQYTVVGLQGEPLIANTTSQPYEVKFEGYQTDTTWQNYSKKIVFSTQVIDPVQSIMSEGVEGFPYWEDVEQIDEDGVFYGTVPYQVMQAPGFTMTVVGYLVEEQIVNGETISTTKYYPTNSVFVRVFPSGPINGGVPGLDPSTNWADVIPETIKEAQDVTTIVSDLIPELTTIICEGQDLISLLTNFTSLDHVVTETSLTATEGLKDVQSNGILNFVEKYKHPTFSATDTTIDEIENKYIYTNRIDATATTTLVGKFVRAVTTSDTSLPIVEITTVTSEGAIDQGIGLKIFSNNNDSTSGLYGAALEAHTKGGTTARFKGGPVGINNTLYLNGHDFNDTTNSVLLVGDPITAGQNDYPLEIRKNGNIIFRGTDTKVDSTLRISQNASVGQTLYLCGGTGIAENNKVLVVSSIPDQIAAYIAVDGAIYCSSITPSSKIELKENILSCDSILDKILSSDICSYSLKADKNHNTRYGLIIGGEYNTPEEILSPEKEGIDLYSMTSFAWKGIQELNEKIESLEARVAELESQLNK